MIEIAVAVLVASFVCLVFATTRILGVLGLVILSLIYPAMIVAILLVGGVAFYYVYRQRRRSGDEPPRPTYQGD